MSLYGSVMSSAIPLIDTLRALSDPTRLRIMRLLASMELAVGELAQVLGQSQPRVSRHVKILCDARLAERRREGAWVFLRTASANTRGTPPLIGAVAQLLAMAEAADVQFLGHEAGLAHDLDPAAGDVGETEEHRVLDLHQVHQDVAVVALPALDEADQE